MVGALAGLVGLAVMCALVWLLLGAARMTFGVPAPVSARQRERDAETMARALAGARWGPAHDEVDGTTRVLVQRSCTGPDGQPLVLDRRVLETWPAADPAWEARFTEAMARARFRCNVLNAEDAAD